MRSCRGRQSCIKKSVFCVLRAFRVPVKMCVLPQILTDGQTGVTIKIRSVPAKARRPPPVRIRVKPFSPPARSLAKSFPPPLSARRRRRAGSIARGAIQDNFRRPRAALQNRSRRRYRQNGEDLQAPLRAGPYKTTSAARAQPCKIVPAARAQPRKTVPPPILFSGGVLTGAYSRGTIRKSVFTGVRERCSSNICWIGFLRIR